MPIGKCAGGCETRVAREGSRCERCARELHAARQRVRRGKPAYPPLPTDRTRALLTAFADARDAVDAMEFSRRTAEDVHGLDGVPFKEVDEWLSIFRTEIHRISLITKQWEVSVENIRSGLNDNP